MHHSQHHRGAGVGAFLAGAATALAVGGYFLYGPNGKENRKKMERWTMKARAEILEKMGDIQDITEDQYYKIVDTVLSRYGTMKAVGKEKAALAAESFKAHWEEMRVRARQAAEEAREELEDEVER
mgnify:CR=1 FL=1